MSSYCGVGGDLEVGSGLYSSGVGVEGKVVGNAFSIAIKSRSVGF